MSSSSRAWMGGVLLACLAGGAAGADTGVDLKTLQVLPQRGQSADQARRDRYECHNWAVEQTGVVPSAQPRTEDIEATRKERADRAVTGAAAGAGIGGLIRSVQGKNPANGILAGAAIGAAVGAATADDKSKTAHDEAFDDYLRALSACLEGRGYRVEAPTPAKAAGSEDAG
jgi:hypothetical protein